MTTPPEPQSQAAESAILAVNIGSSSLKYAAYTIAEEKANKVGPQIVSGNLQGIEPTEESLHKALTELRARLSQSIGAKKIKGIAHRVVHGGDRYLHSLIVTPAVLEELHRLDRLAPLHQPHNLRGISVLMKAFPDVPQVACFDTSFHATLPETEKAFALTQAIYARVIRRFGFHGLSYQYVSQSLSQRTKAAKRRLLMAHLGNGASLCACVDGKSIATTMGFSAAAGLMMGTRCGDLDPGVILHLVQEGMSAEDLETLLYRQSGLKGMSGISADMRVLRQSQDEYARFAIRLFEHQVIRAAGGLIATMGGIDAIAFTGGIGENDALLRKEVCDGLRFLGVDICTQRNSQPVGPSPVAIHAEQSAVEVWAVATDEGRVAAQQALELL